MSVTLKVRNIDSITKLFDMGLGARPTIGLQLVVQGPAAAYALVWEWGRVDINPGPKTMLSTNPDGDQAVMTITAPNGFIRVNRAKYRVIVREEFAAVAWNKVKPANIPKQVRLLLKRAALRCADLIAETAPIDSGDLRYAIRAAEERDDVLQETSDRITIRPRVRP